MQTGKQAAIADITSAADKLIEIATLLGLVVTIEQKPLEPLSMGHYVSVVSVREARK